LRGKKEEQWRLESEAVTGPGCKLVSVFLAKKKKKGNREEKKRAQVGFQDEEHV
jgi:hypothetical protein